MKARIIQEPSTVNSDGVDKKLPLIFITSFNGDYYNYVFELQVNGIYVMAAPCPHPNCHCLSFGAEEGKHQTVEELDPFVRAYVAHFLDSRHFDAFDKPLCEGAFSDEHTQFEIINYEFCDNVHTVKLLVNGAYVEVIKEHDSDNIIIHSHGNTAYIDKVSQEIRDFIKPILDAMEEDELK